MLGDIASETPRAQTYTYTIHIVRPHLDIDPIALGIKINDSLSVQPPVSRSYWQENDALNEHDVLFPHDDEDDSEDPVVDQAVRTWTLMFRPLG
ncbi:uncharacterized protein I303_104013 [Kwoniella dejecticola CBS 10117]|uniref:Uncharacterized protein n=1 Tax=Kwoniella dejecticola CBS 10117 TaxID=1296121 RepID=A0A1A6A8C9_9TREE|nr:uncharacterized protein I303_04032 [Kwoniella dejecticola CBS 10117]OBR86308.1 hypothetical protein I303_04032 [Kwoniella dejecticola CBS 10117]